MPTGGSLSHSHSPLSSGTQFFENTTALYFVGANYWEGANLGSVGPGGNRSRLLHDLDIIAQAGVKHLRILGSSEGPNNEPWRIVPSLQPCPGVYDADVLDGLDFFVAEIGKRGMRATMVLGDEWPWSGGHVQLVSWADQGCVPPEEGHRAATPDSCPCHALKSAAGRRCRLCRRSGPAAAAGRHLFVVAFARLPEHPVPWPGRQQLVRLSELGGAAVHNARRR